MADEVTRLEANGKYAMFGVTNDANLFTTMLRLDPVTKRLLVDAGTISASSASVGATGSGIPTSADFLGISDGVNLRGVLQAANALNSTGNGLMTSQIIAQFDDVSPTAITENQFGNLRMSTNRNLYGTIRDAAGNERGANVDANNNLGVVLPGETTKVIGTIRNVGNVGGIFDAVTGAAVPANALYKGVQAITSLPTAVSNAQLVGAAADKYGRQVALLGTIRDLVGTQTTTISASTAETTIVTAAASIFNDLMMLIVSNTSTATNTRLDFRDTTGGSVLFSLQSNGGQPPIGFALGGASVPQTSVNTNWTAQCATSTTDIRVYAVYAKNK